jgi:hypothetical protein
MMRNLRLNRINELQDYHVCHTTYYRTLDVLNTTPSTQAVAAYQPVINLHQSATRGGHPQATLHSRSSLYISSPYPSHTKSKGSFMTLLTLLFSLLLTVSAYASSPILFTDGNDYIVMVYSQEVKHYGDSQEYLAVTKTYDSCGSFWLRPMGNEIKVLDYYRGEVGKIQTEDVTYFYYDDNVQIAEFNMKYLYLNGELLGTINEYGIGYLVNGDEIDFWPAYKCVWEGKR